VQVLSGLRYLNSPHASGARAIIHYDLKPGNILFDLVGDAKITDFGLSKFVEEADKDIELTSQGTGTYWWTHIHKLPPPCTHFWRYLCPEGTYRPSVSEYPRTAGLASAARWTCGPSVLYFTRCSMVLALLERGSLKSSSYETTPCCVPTNRSFRTNPKYMLYFNVFEVIRHHSPRCSF